MKTINALLLASVVALTSACTYPGHGGKEHDGKCCDKDSKAASAGHAHHGEMPMMDDKMHEHMQAMHEKMQKVHENMNGMQELMLTIQQTKPSAARTKMLKEHMVMLEDTSRMMRDMSAMKDMPMMAAKDDQHTMPPMNGMKKCDTHNKPKGDCPMGKMMQHMDTLQIMLQQQMMMHQMAAVHHGK